MNGEGQRSCVGEIQGFISRFHLSQSVDEVFTRGCCYWFAFILCQRFAGRSRLMYDQIDNHFMAEIDGRLYDITGDITGKYDAEPWDGLEDEFLKQRIERDCILF